METNEMATSTVTPERSPVARLANSAVGIDGVRSALVLDAEGAVLGSAGFADPAREAAVASFVALRAEALPVDGDLRGMGRQLAGSRLQHVSISGPSGDHLIFALDGPYLYLELIPGRAPAVISALAPSLRRFAPHPATRSR